MPNPLPSKGAWAFYNIDRAAPFFMTLESISITESNPDDVAVLSGQIIDEAAAQTFEAEDLIWATFDGERMFYGDIKIRGRTQLSEAGVRVYEIEAQDRTAKLDDTIIRRKVARKREKIKRRLRWLKKVSHFAYDLDLSDVPDEYLDKNEYFGMSILEAHEQIADEKNLHFQMDFDADQDGTPTLRVFRNQTVSAPFALNDDDPDYSTSFPYAEFQDSDDSSELTNAVLVEPEKRNKAVWVLDTASIAEFGRQESYVSDSEVTKRRKALLIGERALSENDQPLFEGSLLCWQPGLRSGQTVSIKNATWGLEYSRVITSIEISAVDPHDENDEAHLYSRITFSDRRRPNRRSRPNGAGGPRKNNRRRRGRIADPSDYTVTDFPDVIVAGAPTDGASVNSWSANGFLARTLQDHNLLYEPKFSISNPIVKQVGSYLGSWYKAWISRFPDSGCPGLDNQFTGWVEDEWWFSLNVGTHPSNAAGIRTQLRLGHGTGYGKEAAAVFEVVALSSLPTATRQGVVVGTLRANNVWTDVSVPQSSVPASGGKLYVGIRTKWQAEYGDWTCGWTWPRDTFPGIKSKLSGKPWSGYSGRGMAPAIQVAIWQINAAAPDWGTVRAYDNSSIDEATFQGGQDLDQIGTEGSPDTVEMTGKALRLTASSAAGVGFALRGSRADATQEEGAWSDFGWACTISFQINRLGDSVAAGARNIELVTIGEGERSIGKVHLGDSQYANGISVAGPSGTVYLERAITPDVRMRARFDTRSGELRGKMWVQSAGEPADWDVVTPLAETEDDDDQFQFWLRAGDGGTDHILSLYRITGAVQGSSGDRIQNELIGKASGQTATFKTTHQYEGASLRVFVNGMAVKPVAKDPEGASFTLDFKPTNGSYIRASYVAD